MGGPITSEEHRCSSMGGLITSEEHRCSSIGSRITYEERRCSSMGGRITSEEHRCSSMGGRITSEERRCSSKINVKFFKMGLARIGENPYTARPFSRSRDSVALSRLTAPEAFQARWVSRA